MIKSSQNETRKTLKYGSSWKSRISPLHWFGSNSDKRKYVKKGQWTVFTVLGLSEVEVNIIGWISIVVNGNYIKYNFCFVICADIANTFNWEFHVLPRKETYFKELCIATTYPWWEAHVTSIFRRYYLHFAKDLYNFPHAQI